MSATFFFSMSSHDKVMMTHMSQQHKMDNLNMFYFFIYSTSVSSQYCGIIKTRWPFQTVFQHGETEQPDPQATELLLCDLQMSQSQ